MTKSKDLTGLKVGNLTVLHRVRTPQNQLKWQCQCDCGNETQVFSGCLNRKSTRSCGCKRGRTTHNLSKSRLYEIWLNMKRRCTDHRNKTFKNYGGRGITVCPSWKNFEIFKEWAKVTGYSDALTLDRIDVNKGYYPENCRWATITEQQRNRRDTVLDIDTVQIIRTMHKYGLQATEIAKQLQLKMHTVHKVCAGQNWRGIPCLPI